LARSGHPWKAETINMRRESRFVTALKERFNVLGLSTAAAVSAATLNPLPLLVGLVAEAAYLLFVPDSKWYDQRLSKRHEAEIEQRRQELKAQVLPTLRPSMQARFTHLEETRAQIVAQPTAGQSWFLEVLRKLDYLLEKFLQFSSKEAQFRSYLQSLLDEVRGGVSRRVPSAEQGFDLSPVEDARERRGRGGAQWPDRPRSIPVRGERGTGDREDRWVQQAISEVQTAYDNDMAELQGLIESEPDKNSRSVLEKRLDVLRRRHESVAKIGRILTNLNHQLELLEDTFGLINDEIRARSPEQILSDIEEVVWQTDTMTKVLEEVAPFDQLVARL
jgi:hypothetical protein